MNFFLEFTQRLKQYIPSRIIQMFSVAAYPYKHFMHKNKCIFIHIPKTAGSSVLQLFHDGGARWHLSWLHYFRANQRCFKHYYKFTVVREPIARLFSAYNYCVAGGNLSAFDVAMQQLIKENSVDFNSFIIKVLSTDFILQQELFLPQYLYIYDRQFTCRVDKILRYERLSEEWKTIASEQGFPQRLPKVNVTKAILKNSGVKCASQIPNLSDAALAKVMLLYQKDFELLNYPMRISKNSQMNEPVL